MIALVVALVALTLGALLIFVALAVPNPVKGLLPRRNPAKWGLAPEPIRLEDGCAGWFFAHPTSRRVVVVCHGRSRSKDWMLPVIARLVQDDAVLVFDFKGHGDSPFAWTTLGMGESKTVRAAVDHARRRGFGDIVLYGTSMGGAAAVIAMGDQPMDGVTAIVTDGTFDRLTNVFANVGRYIGMSRRVTLAVISPFARVVRYEADEVSPVLLAPAIVVPGLFMHGDRDPLVPKAAAAALAVAWGGPSEAFIYRGYHDNPRNLEMQGKLLQWLASLPQPS